MKAKLVFEYVKEHAENCSASDVYDAWTVEFEKLLSRCFRKRTIKEREILMKISRKGKVQRKETKIPRPKVEKSEIYAYFVLVKKIEERSRQVDSTGILVYYW